MPRPDAQPAAPRSSPSTLRPKRQLRSEAKTNIYKMINYIVYERGNPQDRTQPKKLYAKAQYTDVVDLEEFARHISEHNNVYDEGDIHAVLLKMVKCLRELVLEGKKVDLGVLGTFSAVLTSTGADSAEEFSVRNITSVSLAWDKGKRLDNMLPEATLNQVTTRAIQSAALKAHKAGKGSASWGDTAATPADSDGDGNIG